MRTLVLSMVCLLGGSAWAEAPAAVMKRARSSSVELQLPEVDLVRDDGKTVPLSGELNDGRPVVLNFVFTSCGTICPVMSQIFSQLQKKVGDDVHLVSITIDPENDTPSRLAEYAKKFNAGPRWRFYTGTTETSVATQRAFETFRGDKMSHTPVAFLRARAGQRWIRIDGFASADELATELRQLLRSP
jgi:protein SCO1